MASSTKLHSATLVTNIKTCVPIHLDDEGTNFNTWVTLFKLHCRAHLVDTHILPVDSSKASAYCNELETLATSLNTLGTSIFDNRLALQVLHGLTTDYRTFQFLVQHMSPVPSFDTLRSMLELEEHSHNKDNSSSHDSALFTTPKPSSIEHSENFEPRDTPNHRGGHHNHHRGGRSSRGNHHSHHTHPG
ncbi:NEDD8-specific protease 1-like [Amaranthus tricolor]|uniref:NEDD8-specific protease 1-like n=1 Tax=Amaranthus tricolor TaxID=29722 RepID=UPI00258E235D|nr:NEDD8-specific protease 1-like [Amaranthus tricolor]